MIGLEQLINWDVGTMALLEQVLWLAFASLALFLGVALVCLAGEVAQERKDVASLPPGGEYMGFGRSH